MAKVRVTGPIPGLFRELQPEAGRIYDGEVGEIRKNENGKLYVKPVCVINMDGKRILLRKGEFEVVPETVETCVCCGAVVPEGRQVCPSCEKEVHG